MISILLREGEILAEPQKMELFSDSFCRNPDLDQKKRPSKKLFNKCIAFATHYLGLDTKTRKLYDDVAMIYGQKFRGQQDMRTWCDQFVSDIKSLDEILEFIDLAEASGNSTLYILACTVIVNDMKDNIDVFRAKYNIKNDFTADEIKQLTEEDKLWDKVNSVDPEEVEASRDIFDE